MFKHTDQHTTLNCAILSHITGTTPSTKMDTHAWKFHKDIKLNDEEFHQVGGIDLLMELTYSMKYFDQTEGHVLVFIQFYK